MKTMLSTMLALATEIHDGQYDRGGMPYILHPLKVMHYLKSDDEELMCIALGHDMIEDCPKELKGLVETQRLLYIGFTPRIIEGIHALTKVEGETYEQYKAKVKANPDAVRVKMADLRHNTDIRRLKGVTEKDIKRTATYHAFYEELKACL